MKPASSGRISRLALFGWTLLLCLGMGSLLVVPAGAANRPVLSAPQTRLATEDFKIVFFPDSQNESTNYPAAFNAQTTWIANNMAAQNIVFATHMGDIVDTATNTSQWVNADAAMDILDLGSVPYSVGPGNHDLGGKYNDYFGVDRFSGKPWYGGYYGTNNNNNYSLFSASGMDFILINLEYAPDSGMRSWADGLLTTYASRRAIVVSHSILTSGGSLSTEGASLFNALKKHPNLFLMMCGHAGNAYLAQQGDDGHTIHIMEADFEGWPYGGDGVLRVLTFSPANDIIHVTSYSTYSDYYEDAYPYAMDLIYDMESPTGAFGKSAPLEGATGVSANPTLRWGTSTGATSYEYCYATTNPCTNWTSVNLNTSVVLSGLSYGQTYYWQVRAINLGVEILANGGNTWAFTTITPPGAFSKTSPSDGATNLSVSPTLSWGTSSGATRYEYCYATTNPCSNWTSVGLNTSVALSGLANSQTYYWHVRSSNSLATTYAGGVTTDWSFTTAPLPGVFGKISPTSGALDLATNPTLSWGTSSSAASYQYCYATTNPCSNWTSAGTNTSVTLSGLANYQVYYWQVRAVNPGGTTLADAGTSWSFTTILAPPGAFSKTGPSNGATGVSVNPTLSWGTSSGATRYEYCIDTSNPCSNWISTSLNTSITLSGLANSQTYYWHVRASNSLLTTYAGGVTTDWSFTTAPLPGAFGKISPTSGATSVSVNPTLSWGTSSSAASYEYCYATTNPCSSWTTAGTKTSVTLSGLANNQVFYWQVRAVNPGGTTLADAGTSWSFTTTVAAPAAFSKTSPLTGATGVSTSPTLSWGISSGAAAYEYCYATTTGCSVFTSVGMNTSVSLTGLSYNQTYYWQVRAVNLGGTTLADAGADWSFTTAIAPPAAFNKTSPLASATGVSTNPSLSWGTSARAVSYEYCYAATPDCSVFTPVGTNTSVVLSGLIRNQVYYWQVRAVNPGGTTLADAGAYWSFTTLPFQVFIPLVIQ